MPKQYQIRLDGHLDHSWAEWFDDLTISHLPTGETLLSGELIDQAALHGVLARIRDLGLALLAVTAIPDRDRQPRDDYDEGRTAS